MKVTTGIDRTAQVTLSIKEIIERLFPFLPIELRERVTSYEERFVFIIKGVDDQALDILNEHFPDESPAPLLTGIDTLLNMRLKDLDGELSTRAINTLTAGQYTRLETLRELVSLSRGEIRRFQNLGEKTYIELDKFLVSKGLKWSER